jgi:hypothetical protein
MFNRSIIKNSGVELMRFTTLEAVLFLLLAFVYNQIITYFQLRGLIDGDNQFFKITCQIVVVLSFAFLITAWIVNLARVFKKKAPNDAG